MGLRETFSGPTVGTRGPLRPATGDAIPSGMTTLPPPVRGFAEVNGARLHYELQGDGFPVVLLHGGALDSRMWDGQVGPLSQHFTTLRYDQRGFGQTELPAGQPSAPHEDLRALLDTLSMDRVHLVGHSLGGRVALAFALAFPERLSCLVLVAPEDPSTRLEQVRAPTLLLVGDKDNPAVLRSAEELARRVPALTRVTFPGVGHLPNVERPEDFNRALLDFLVATRDG
jgi:pimeloyl-ACP methyl ester carboxylesterase